MARGLLFAVLGMGSVAVAGCLLPTPLTEASSTDLPPVLLSDDPPFGALSLTQSEARELHIKAEDPDEGDTLTARLFVPGQTGATSRVYLGLEKTLMAEATPNAQGLVVRTTTFFDPTGVALCQLYGQFGELYVVVSDRAFSNTPGQESASAGLTDEKFWELKCQ